MSLVNDLDTEVENFKREYEKFERGNKSAGTRARKVLQDIKKTCQGSADVPAPPEPKYHFFGTPQYSQNVSPLPGSTNTPPSCTQGRTSAVT